MDTLFWTPLILQSSDQQQQSSFNSTITATSFNSHQYPINYNYQHQEEEECFNPFMDGDDFSSSHQPPTATPPYAPLYESSSSATHDHHSSSYPPHHDITLEFNSLVSGRWLSDILLEASRAISEKNSTRLHELMWMLNELSSPYGDIDQKLAHYFLQALFSRITDSGYKSYCNLTSSSLRNLSFESTRKNLLKFQEVSPWTTFGHTACNGAIMEAFQGETKLHIIDFSNTFCTQWPTLLEALATRGDDETPCLRLTTVVRSGGSAQRVMREIGCRMEKFARLMAVPFKFNVINRIGDLSELDFNLLNLLEEEALVINCVGSLHSVKSDSRDLFISMIRRLQPRIVTVVEEEVDLDVGVEGHEFVKGFEECLRWFRVYFECLDDCFSKTSNERLALERSAGRAMVDLVACPPSESKERRETSARWSRRFHAVGFNGVLFSDEVSDDVSTILRRHKEGWTMRACSNNGMLLMWNDEPVVWASAWKPC